MDEKDGNLLEVLKLMKELHENGFYLNKEINAVIKLILSKYGLSKEVIDTLGK